MIVVFRFKNVQADVNKDGELTVYNPDTGKILVEGKVTKIYE